LKKDFGMTILFVTHDMGIVAQLTNRVVVLYSGKVCEIADTETLFSKARHPYTEALISSVPSFDYKSDRRRKLKVIEGNVPDPISLPPGCRFHPRCAYADTICKSKVPDLIEIEPGHMVSCFYAENK
ncbi:MAG: oligopeptide/dipeptide ABC transporter ATP-binding protein, partial [Fervidobacterium sp.]